ncbi:D(5)-like dopamine receptor [Exaiptasia diaphana]|uniref:G-protein coupled receptors family 1 profile domain-containing protein n=1 Tax=Exaiptasia diaphana TaxID=2652724 RepID=A0A913WTS0_EXADI|nr:D(5)-like dopamine receptor [Exaiptasia diaphana]XP_020893990.1 D(5)-like dopamine receptor [Exaiptasia diaphana]XP_020893992.1 D(5)-like dopamine receptor [Exaiptasia diaphana]XP_020893994.1 D(5)-like dopamine receptor [Exaiptasia diaphana]XP_020893995.1 D(5)-like dopamine receptor [Exaiptasia diaphana]XP_028513110.1 D(5)-like dopamine receptor [Exaiptasia diaphana]XP_028513111.1 D(5)-like dopamine receptor [Exaiptasia diaphana]XP_028513112.1 D(5)-like dopamine receptor [Exaiptasia diaph
MNRTVMLSNNTGQPPLIPKETTSAITAATFTCILIICTLVANVFVCFATLRFDSIRPLTNYFIVNLCIADIFIAVISMPVWVLYQIFPQPHQLSSLLGVKFMLFWSSTDILCGTASILSLSCISVDRYLAITRPLTYVRCMTWRRAFVMIIAVWCYAGTVAFLRQPMRGGQSNTLYALFVLMASFVLPLIVIVVTYSKIFCVARKHAREMVRRSSISQETSEKFKRVSRDLKAAKTISVVIGTFVFCWAPFLILSVCYAYKVKIHMDVANITKWMAYTNALLNPLVYSFVDKQLRSLVIKVIICYNRQRDPEVHMPLRAI